MQVTEAYEEYIRTSLDSLAPIAHSRSALASHLAAAPAPDAQLELLFPAIFDAPGSLASSGSGSAPSSPMHLGPPPLTVPPMPPPPEQAPPVVPPMDASSAAALSPRWAGQQQRAGDATGPSAQHWGTTSVPDISPRASGWGNAKPSSSADVDLRSSAGWNGAKSGSNRPTGTARIQLGAGKSDASAQASGAHSLPSVRESFSPFYYWPNADVPPRQSDSRLAEHRPPSPLPSPRAASPQRSAAKALPPVPPQPSSGRSPVSSGRSAAPERGA
jgi:hypothetical protein